MDFLQPVYVQLGRILKNSKEKNYSLDIKNRRLKYMYESKFERNAASYPKFLIEHITSSIQA